MFTMLFLVSFVFLLNLVIRQGNGDPLLSKLKSPFSTPVAFADHPAEGAESAESAESGSGCESGCGSSCESGCAVASEIS